MQALFTVFAFVDGPGDRLSQRKKQMRVDVNSVNDHNLASVLTAVSELIQADV